MDSRSLVYDGRLIVPTDVKTDEFAFRNVPLLQGRTDMAEILPGHGMKAIEDVSASTGRWGRMVALEVAQLGQDAMEKILEAATQDICMADQAFMIFLRGEHALR